MTEEADGPAIARRLIAEEAAAQTGFLDLGRLGLTELPEELFALKHLRRLNLGAFYRQEDGDFAQAESRGPPNEIQSELGRLVELPVLQSLACRGTRVSDLGPLSGLTALQSLDCWGTRVNDLGPLSGLTALQSLACGGTQVRDLGPLSGLTALQSLACWGTRVRDLGPLSGLTALQSLGCGGTQVRDLGPLSGLTALQSLYCREVGLHDFPEDLLRRPSLVVLDLRRSRVPGIPDEVLSGDDDGNCLPALRAHLDDLCAGAVDVSDVKLMVLGNGRVGKTQICNRLRGEAFEPDADSTHGIIVRSAELPLAGAAPARLNIWDFGGQDIYHGTHALFLRSNAVFVLVWSPGGEAEGEHVHDGMVFRNQPLAYWLDNVRHLGGRAAPVLIVQTRCDRPEDEALHPPLEDAALGAFGFRKILHYSALKDRGRAALDEALGEAVSWLRRRQGIATIGAGRHRVKQRLTALRDADARVQAEERQYRTIAKGQFLAICAAAGGVSSPDHLLDYLHNAGIVFYRKGLFKDRIVLDQGWALEAIYAVFNRKHCFEPLRQLGGRFTRKLLAALVWQSYSEAEQDVFLGMMRACGICFVHKHGDTSRGIEPEYVAPDFLPERQAVEGEIAARWDEGMAGGEAIFEYPLLHAGLIRTIIARIGAEAGGNAVYWRGGVCVHETRTGSDALIEQEESTGWSGRLYVRVRGGRAGELLPRMVALVEEAQAELGLDGKMISAAPPSPTPDERRPGVFVRPQPHPATETAEATNPVFGPPPRAPGKRWFVSYAWKDDKTAEGKEREAIVDRLCEEAEARGAPIVRDKDALRIGDSISKFMDQIGQGDRIFAILSEKYLKSPFCMYELFSVWRECRQNEEEFVDRLRVYVLDDAKIFSPGDRMVIARYWRDQFREISKALAEDPELVGRSDFTSFSLMVGFAHQVAEILAIIANRRQPQKFEELVAFGLTDGE